MPALLSGDGVSLLEEEEEALSAVSSEGRKEAWKEEGRKRRYHSLTCTWEGRKVPLTCLTLPLSLWRKGGRLMISGPPLSRLSPHLSGKGRRRCTASFTASHSGGGISHCSMPLILPGKGCLSGGSACLEEEEENIREGSL